MNRSLIEAIITMIENRRDKVFFEWTKAHVGTMGNEMADTLAHGYAMECASGARPEKLPIIAIRALEENKNLDNGGERKYDFNHPTSLKQPKNKKPWRPHAPRRGN